MTQPLRGVKVLDFSTLLPGPLCTLLLAEAGADVIKVERPVHGDEMRSYKPKLGSDSANFALLNRGKRSVALDLKSAEAIEALEPLVRDADVLVEQFRPGVMGRLGLGYGVLSALNPRLIYCSITGYGQHGPRAQDAAHDLNYVASTGMLSLSCGGDGAPALPPALIADIAGGAYPAMINILLALRQREQTGRGTFLDIAMADNLFTLQYWGLGDGWRGTWPTPGSGLVTGGSPRYRIYRTSDGQYLAAAPIEDKFWSNFVRLIGLEEDALASLSAHDAIARVAEVIARHPACVWEQRFRGQDVCTARVVSLDEACRDPHFTARGLFSRSVTSGTREQMPALPVPVTNAFRGENLTAPAPVRDTGSDSLPAWKN
ncbi:CaiB/BaiF CoA-transferase family protein [Cupriavidus basilensis]|uniref:CaiB/BaiF CoA-transferase family protein n=1 Tax=Cupriavidus basilensis TaxID=68895 RepID=A0ABT6B4V1_9BURK|nr:CaiB/BaiF CoA-transferase family protein [Cupriavidus basilensis]MDF3839910.1 CaiB/BaiF CoA-transferase family protein [Cupriavidus basilensis]